MLDDTDTMRSNPDVVAVFSRSLGHGRRYAGVCYGRIGAASLSIAKASRRRALSRAWSVPLMSVLSRD